MNGITHLQLMIFLQTEKSSVSVATVLTTRQIATIYDIQTLTVNYVIHVMINREIYNSLFAKIS